MQKHLHTGENPFLFLTPPPADRAVFQGERRKQLKSCCFPNGCEGFRVPCMNAFRAKAVAATASILVSPISVRVF